MQPKLLLLIFILLTFTISVTPETPDYVDSRCIVKDKPLGPFNGTRHSKVVDVLKKMIDRNNWTADFEKAVADAHSTGISEMLYIKNLSDYYNFLNDFVYWVPKEDETGSFVYRMICTMYFVLDQKSVIDYQSRIEPGCSQKGLSELSQWMVDFANEMGRFLDTPQSLTEETLRSFYTAQNYNLDAYEIPKGGWLGHSFNEFFARNFTKGTRPIDGPNNPAVIVSGADSTFDGCWNIRNDSTVILKKIRWSIKELLDDSIYGDQFADGKFMHAFLGPSDYHRQHAPVDGTVLEAKVIPGHVYLEVVVKKDPNGELVLAPIRNIDNETLSETSNVPIRPEAPDNPGYQFCQSRGLVIIKSQFGLVAVLPVGMAQVSSVVLNDKIIPSRENPNPKVKKGDEISHFQFGGSDIVLVFQKDSNVDVLANLGRHYRVGEQIAIAHNITNT
ncbi:unnamed protein product [Rhizophagus irregularis]|uniref:Phosphatidylserine decarboxylase-related protein n=5 Tax=Rhizophagus irregularis TaxID=588596 RepID=A0A915Z842_9GLOM